MHILSELHWELILLCYCENIISYNRCFQWKHSQVSNKSVYKNLLGISRPAHVISKLKSIFAKIKKEHF